MLMDQYADKLIGVIGDIRDTQREQILAAARLAADTSIPPKKWTATFATPRTRGSTTSFFAAPRQRRA